MPTPDPSTGDQDGKNDEPQWPPPNEAQDHQNDSHDGTSFVNVNNIYIGFLRCQEPFGS
jgi:hypothetical protein